MTWEPNPGHCPAEVVGKRVRVQLANGMVGGMEPVSAVSPTGWAADSTRWSRTGHPFDVERYEVVK